MDALPTENELGDIRERGAEFVGDLPEAWHATDELRIVLARPLFREAGSNDYWVVAGKPLSSVPLYLDLDYGARRISDGSDGDRTRACVMDIPVLCSSPSLRLAA